MRCVLSHPMSVCLHLPPTPAGFNVSREIRAAQCCCQRSGCSCTLYSSKAGTRSVRETFGGAFGAAGGPPSLTLTPLRCPRHPTQFHHHQYTCPSPVLDRDCGPNWDRSPVTGLRASTDNGRKEAQTERDPRWLGGRGTGLQNGSHRYIQVHTGTYRYVQVRSGTYRYIQVHTGTHRYIQVHTGTFRYSQIDTSTHNYTRCFHS